MKSEANSKAQWRAFRGLRYPSLFVMLGLSFYVTLSKVPTRASEGEASGPAANAVTELASGAGGVALAGDQIAQKTTDRLSQRDSHVLHYCEDRTYKVLTGEKPPAVMNVRMSFNSPPADKVFNLLSKTNPSMVSNMVYERAIKAETDMLVPDMIQRTSLTPQNYDFKTVGQETKAGAPCYVIELTPKRKEAYLIQGRIWVSTDKFDVVRIEGSPAKSPSVWIKGMTFARQFQNVNGYWMPGEDESNIEVRMYGHIHVAIQHHDYQIKN